LKDFKITLKIIRRILMNIQPVSAFNIHANITTPKTRQNTTFKGDNRDFDSEKLNKTLKALAAASAIAFTPAMITSCDKEHFCDENCDHPNHIDNPNFNPQEPGADTIKNGVNYILPELTMKRYIVDGGDTVRLGNVKFSESVIHVPYNAHKTSELKTVMNFIDILGLDTKTADKEYVATKSFSYNAVPAQLTWLNEKSGTVNQLKFNGYEKDKNLVTLDLISIPADASPVEQKLEITSAGVDKLLVNVFDKEKENKLNSMLFTLKNDTISQFNVTENGTYAKTFEYTKDSSNSVTVTNKDGEDSKLANFDTILAISKEEE